MGPNALGKLARRRIDPKLTGEKQRVAQLDARRVRTDGGRSIRGSNSLFVHTGSIQESKRGFPFVGSGLWLWSMTNFPHAVHRSKAMQTFL